MPASAPSTPVDGLPVDVSGRPLELRAVDLDRFLHPRTVAVIGASEASRKPNTAMTRKLKAWVDRHGATFYPVHPTYETVVGERCYPTVFDVPGEIDLAVILTGKAVETFEEVVQRKAAFAVIFAAGFSEVGGEGDALEARLDELALLDGWREALAARAPRASDRLLDTARIEAGRPRFGVDMHDDTIPLEAGIESRAIDHDKGCYVGQEIVIRILHRGQGRVARRLVWLEAAAPPHTSPWPVGTDVLLGDRTVGVVTSACWSPQHRGLLGIAMVHRDAAEPDTIVGVAGGDARVTRLP